MSQPLDFGLCEDSTYMLLSWLESEDRERSGGLLAHAGSLCGSRISVLDQVGGTIRRPGDAGMKRRCREAMEDYDGSARSFRAGTQNTAIYNESRFQHREKGILK